MYMYIYAHKYNCSKQEQIQLPIFKHPPSRLTFLSPMLYCSLYNSERTEQKLYETF